MWVCAYCGWDVTDTAAPSTWDEEGWAHITPKHESNCAWAQTRAHTGHYINDRFVDSYHRMLNENGELVDTQAFEETNMKTINRHSTNLGYGWTTQPRGVRGAPLIVKAHEQVTGTLDDVLAERQNMLRIIGSGTYHEEALFVDGQRVITINGTEIRKGIEALYWLLEDPTMELDVDVES